jgi:DNA-binding NarL/FixJ family response regulator
MVPSRPWAALKVKILLVDGQSLVREGLASLLNAQPDLVVVGQASCVLEALALADHFLPDVILSELELPDGSGLDLMRHLRDRHPGIRIAVLASSLDETKLFRSVCEGVHGYMLKSAPAPRLLDAVRAAAFGQPTLDPWALGRLEEEFRRIWPDHELPDAERTSQLTRREREVLRALAAGATNREIAGRLAISENTVRNHVRSILAKLEVPSRRQAGLAAIRNRV